MKLNTNTVFISDDGSKSVYNRLIDESFHSHSGALTESAYVYVFQGFSKFKSSVVNLLEIGYGTGLNAMLTYKANLLQRNIVQYHGVDTEILSDDILKALKSNASMLQIDNEYEFFVEHWNVASQIDDNFMLYKHKCSIHDFCLEEPFDLIYHDAFSPEKQPDMWSEELFQKLFTWLRPGGTLVTYSSKGIVKERLRSAGFVVKRLKGLPPKRHMLCAFKPITPE